MRLAPLKATLRLLSCKMDVAWLSIKACVTCAVLDVHLLRTSGAMVVQVSSFEANAHSACSIDWIHAPCRGEPAP